MSADTIFATATAPGRAGIAVVRISGPDAHSAAAELAGPVPAHGRGLRRLRGSDGELIDEALVLTFAPGRSFTGEGVVELHLHGSGSVVARVLSELERRPGLRLAEAGEFSRRAMENGRLDLAQAEGLADLLDAETEAQRIQAMRVFSGGLSDLCEMWRAHLLHAAALLEATMDFADEEVPVDVGPEVMQLLTAVRTSLSAEVAGVPVAERVRDGFEVAIVGSPNVGKSTLLNHLVGREAAITSDIPGTTRDVIEVRTVIQGLPVTFLDTAGLRESNDGVERLGIAKGRERAGQADLRVVLIATGEAPPVGLDREDIVLFAKMDETTDGSGISGVTGAGVESLVSRIGQIFSSRVATVGRATSERHERAIKKALGALDAAVERLESEDDHLELIAADLAVAVRAIDSLIGRIDVEDVLGEIFSRFCIGK